MSGDLKNSAAKGTALFRAVLEEGGDELGSRAESDSGDPDDCKENCDITKYTVYYVDFEISLEIGCYFSFS